MDRHSRVAARRTRILGALAPEMRARHDTRCGPPQAPRSGQASVPLWRSGTVSSSSGSFSGARDRLKRNPRVGQALDGKAFA